MKSEQAGTFSRTLCPDSTAGTAAVFERASKEQVRVDNSRYRSAHSTRSQKSSAVGNGESFPRFRAVLTLTQYVAIASLCISKRKEETADWFPSCNQYNKELLGGCRQNALWEYCFCGMGEHIPIDRAWFLIQQASALSTKEAEH